jgi:hypothetical protein
MGKSDEEADLPNKELVRALQEELSPVEPPAQIREAMLKRILNRTLSSWQAWLGRSKDRLDD